LAAVVVIVSAHQTPGRPPAARTGGSAAGEPGHEGEPLVVDAPGDTFDRSDDPASLGTIAGVRPGWRAAAGNWGVAGGQARVSGPVSGRNLAVLPAGGEVEAVQVRVARVVNGAGLVFAYRSPLDYWAVVASPVYATWAVLQVADGRERVVADTGLSPLADGTAVAVSIDAGTVDVAVDGTVRRTVVAGGRPAAGAVGLTAAGPDGSQARFDDLRVEVRR